MRIEPLGDRAVLIRFGDVIDESVHARVMRAVRQLHRFPFHGMGEVVPAYGAVAVYYGGAWAGAGTADGDEVSSRYASIVSHIERVLESSGDAVQAIAPARIVEIPVCYGEEYGPDIAVVAARAQLGESEVAVRHAAASYRVAMLGFSPGFPFLLGLPPELTCPRRDTPRRAVPAGSVGIAGRQTGVYPLESPGGWQIIGRTPLALFDVEREPPALLQPGDGVRFVAISRAEFERMRA